jgi:hypothetical protein
MIPAFAIAAQPKDAAAPAILVTAAGGYKLVL